MNFLSFSSVTSSADCPRRRSFILIGDSGEQDLNLYVQLACEYPENVLAIYIRDVTTPFKPDSHPDLSHGSSPALSHPHSLSDLTKATDSASLNSKSARPPLPTLFSETPDLPGQFDGSHERPIPPRAAPRPKPSRIHTSFSRRGTTSAPPSPPLVDHDVDPLSPNNPLRTETLKPTQTEEEAALVEAFYQRVLEAEKILPRHVPLRLFRHGAECGEFCLSFVEALRAGADALSSFPFRSEGRRRDCQEGEWVASIDGHIRYSSVLFLFVLSVLYRSVPRAFKECKERASPSREQRKVEQELGEQIRQLASEGPSYLLDEATPSTANKASCSVQRRGSVYALTSFSRNSFSTSPVSLMRSC